jgi:hypothetical protein
VPKMNNSYLDGVLLQELMKAVKAELEKFNFPDEDRPELYEAYNKILEIKKKEFKKD